MKRGQFELKVDSKLENLSVIADFVATVMMQLGIEKGVYEVQTAVDEACTNIMKYAYSGKEGVIAISCELQGNDFIITIVDSGKPFDPNMIPPPDLETDLEQRRIGGLGIHLMRKLMDKVNYNVDTQKGNMLIMRKRVPRRQKS
ncbi:MAG: ATP-binding protein [Dehalococcoidia bacterium]|nr:ATP-binding protein [Dehalococcoidia bacterium]